MKKILPVERPHIFAYTHQCAVHAILMANDECKDWLYSNYIQIYCLKDLYYTHRRGTLDFYYHFYGDFNFYEQYANPWLLMNRLSRRNVKSKWLNEITYIKECIMNDEYVFAVINKQYAYNLNKELFHPVLIYGFDDENETLFCADNNSYGKYDFIEISIMDYLKGCNIPEIEDYYDKRPEGICSFKVRKKSDDIDSYKFYPEKIILDFNSYLNPISKNSFSHVYGIDCYGELCKYFIQVKDNLDDCDLRAISSLLDHKILMVKRFEYMKSHDYLLPNHDKLIEGARLLEERISNQQKMLIKYNLTKDKKIINRVITGLNAICEEEINLLKPIL